MADPTEEPGQEDPESPHGLRKKIDEANQRARDAEAKVAEFEVVQRKLAVHEAGLGNLDEKQVKALFAVHEGDADAAGLQATAKALFGEGAKPAVPTSTPTPAPDQSGLEQMETFGAGGQSADAPLAGRAAFEKQLAEFKGSAAEYDAFLEANMEYLT